MSVPSVTGEPAASDELWAGDPEPDRPVLLAGRAGAAVLAGNGDFFLPWETRGAILDWAGVYGQGIRLTGSWRVSLEVEGSGTLPLEKYARSIEVHRTGVTLRYETPLWVGTQRIAVAPDLPAVCRSFQFASRTGGTLRATLHSELEPYLAPVMVEGVRPRSIRLRGTTEEGLRATHGSFGFGVTWEGSSGWQDAQGNDVSDGLELGPRARVSAHRELRIPPGGQTSTSITVGGGLERSMERSGLPRRVLEAETWGEARARGWSQWMQERPVLKTPGSPLLERGYQLALGALESLYFAPEPDLVGLAAGYPWYSTLWCRDNAWMLPAVLWVGDFSWAADSLATVLRFQSPARVPVLGGEEGELPMQISPGPIFLYGTSDTTLHYPHLFRRFLEMAPDPDPEWVRKLLPRIRACVQWGARKTDPEGLFTNGGEVSEMRRSTASLSSIRYGFDAVDTTIWDSTDRRWHAIDLQVLWLRALEAMSSLERSSSGSGDADLWRNAAARLRQGIAQRYWWEKEGYLYDTLTQAHSPVPKVRPNALLAVLDGLLPPDRAVRVVERASRPDLTTPWGVRTLSTRDPSFDPWAYHDGQVWPIATAWAAQSAFRAARPDLGLRFLETMAHRLEAERGLSAECYHGLEPVPWNSCFLLGFSVAPFLTSIFEGLWGLHVGSDPHLLEVDPRFPDGWDQAQLRGLRIAGTTLDLELRSGDLWVGSRSGPPLRVRHRDVERTLSGGEPVRLPG